MLSGYKDGKEKCHSSILTILSSFVLNDAKAILGLYRAQAEGTEPLSHCNCKYPSMNMHLLWLLGPLLPQFL